MKQKTHLLLTLFWLFLLPQLLPAQSKNADPFSKLKAGDWFQVKAGLKFKSSGLSAQNQYHLKFQLTKQSPNGNQQYALCLERIQIRGLYDDIGWMGFDSWYPVYLQNNDRPFQKPLYNLEIDPQGKILNLKDNQEYPKVILLGISPKKDVSAASIEQEAVPEGILNLICSLTCTLLKQGKHKMLNGRELIAKDNTGTSLSLLLESASFPIAGNTLLKGKISGNTNKQLYLASRNFAIHKDGSFEARVMLQQPSEIGIVYHKVPNLNMVSPLVHPGDTLILSATGKDFSNTATFKGTHAADAALNGDLKTLFYNQTYDNTYRIKTAADFTALQEKGLENFHSILQSRKPTVSREALLYYQTAFMYLQANAKLTFLSQHKYLAGPGSTTAFRGFPNNFFLSIDTIPVLMDNAQTSDWYQLYLRAFIPYQREKLGMTNGGQFGFLANYATAIASLNGYALYFALGNSLNTELNSSAWKNTQTLKPYYEDFLLNCSDTTFTAPVKKQWEKLQLWKPGNPNPVQELYLLKGKKLDLSQFKGKALCLIVNYDRPEGPMVDKYLDFIKKQDPKKIHFIFLQFHWYHYAPFALNPAFSKLKNLSYVEVGTDEINKNTKAWNAQLMINRVFFFDPWQRVSDDFYISSEEKINELGPAVQKAIHATKYSKEQKAALINTIGWSAGSILLTSIAVFFIYKIRITNLKRKEELKRQLKELEIKAIRSQMNPHFIFNALNSIQSLINTKNYPEANIYLEKFSVLMRRVLHNSEKSLVPLSDELEAVTLYCELEKLRFDFNFHIHLEKEVHATLIEIPGMIIQPLVENAILHGIAQKGSAGKLNINIAVEGIYLKIYISDNGPGTKGGETSMSNAKGFGLKLVKERLNLLNNGGIQGKLTINSILEGDNIGTAAILSLPID